MKRKVIKIASLLLSIIIVSTHSLAMSDKILINNDTFKLINKEEKIMSNFDSKYEISGDSYNENTDLNTEITELTKKTTYLLLGQQNSENESSESFYKRRKDYFKLRYAPQIPEDSNSILGLDMNSQEYKDDVVSGIAVPGMFTKLNELEINYTSYGDIRVSAIDENNVMSVITLPDVTMKEQDRENPKEYTRIQTDLTIYYQFKKLDNSYKLYYIYAETNNDIESYINDIDEKRGELSKDSDYNSKLREIYDFSKADAITDDALNKIYNENKDKVVFLNSTYNMGTVAAANGFFIQDGIIVTTYNYIEESLLKAQNIMISDSSNNVYELDGIVTMNQEYDIAILKVKNKSGNVVTIENVGELKKEDGIISLNSKTGVGLSTNKGIIISLDNMIETSILSVPEMQGSLLYNSDGKIIGMINSKAVNMSLSFATDNKILKKYYDMFANENFDEIKAIPFEQLKESYYVKYNDEAIVNNIPESKLKKTSNVEKATELIKLDLIKSSYKDNIISLRYKNNVPNYMDTMRFAEEYIENLKNNGYTEKERSDSKIVLKNKKYEIIVMKEFNYLIIVMVGV